jgi:hypothetical protein
MAVDLGDLVESLQREVSPPGQLDDLFPGIGDDVWIGYLSDGFWEIRLDGMLAGYIEEDGEITPTATGGTDLPRELQQLIVLYAGIRLLRNQLMNTGTLFRAQAGPVEFETQNSAQLLRDLFAELRAKRDFLLGQLTELGLVTYAYIDMVQAREASIGYGGTSFVSGQRRY